MKPSTHLALSFELAKRVRIILGGMPHDQVRDILMEFDSSPTVSINAPSKDSKDEQSD